MMPATLSIITNAFPPEERGKAIGTWAGVSAMALAIGPVVGGFLVEHVSWQSVFFLNIPVAIGAVVVTLFATHESRDETVDRIVDVPGVVAITVGLGSLVLALVESNSWGWGSPRIVGLFAASAVLAAAWVAVELRVPEPMIDMRMLAQRTVLFTNLTALFAGFAMFGAFVLVPNLLELPRGLPAAIADQVHFGFGASPTRTGLYLLPGALLGFFSGPLGGVVGRRYGSRLPLVLGMAIAAVGIAGLAFWHHEAWQVVAAQAVLGIGVPLSFAAMANLIVGAVRLTETGVATGMNTVMRTIGGVIGGQIGAAILTADRIPGTPVPSESAFTAAFAMAAAVAIVGAAMGLFVGGGGRQPVRVRVAEVAD
jgi:MFS family permease